MHSLQKRFYVHVSTAAHTASSINGHRKQELPDITHPICNIRPDCRSAKRHWFVFNHFAADCVAVPRASPFSRDLNGLRSGASSATVSVCRRHRRDPRATYRRRCRRAKYISRRWHAPQRILTAAKPEHKLRTEGGRGGGAVTEWREMRRSGRGSR